MNKRKLIDPRDYDVNEFVKKQLTTQTVDTIDKEIFNLLNQGRSLEVLKKIKLLSPPKGGLKYDKKTLFERSLKRMKKVFQIVDLYSNNSLEYPIKVLDIGCARAENYDVLQELFPNKFLYTGIDIDDQHFPQEKANKRLLKLSVDQLSSKFMGEFDIAFSFNVLEHVDSPIRAINEIVKVLKPNGIFCTIFGPPFNSANGPHLNRYITLPYMHLLFREDVVGEFLGRSDAYYTVNRLTLPYYRQLFLESDNFNLLYYREHINGLGFNILKGMPELIVNYELDDLAVNAFSVMIQPKSTNI